MRDINLENRWGMVRHVDPKKIKDLIHILQIRGTFEDDTQFEPMEGKFVDTISAISKATNSALFYDGNDERLTYYIGSYGSEEDAHARIFDATTIKESDDPRVHETK